MTHNYHETFVQTDCQTTKKFHFPYNYQPVLENRLRCQSFKSRAQTEMDHFNQMTFQPLPIYAFIISLPAEIWWHYFTA